MLCGAPCRPARSARRKEYTPCTQATFRSIRKAQWDCAGSCCVRRKRGAHRSTVRTVPWRQGDSRCSSVSTAGSPGCNSATASAIWRRRPTYTISSGASASSTNGAPKCKRRPLRSDEAQRDAVIAPALTRRRRSVVEHVPLMAAAAHAMVFVALDDDLVVFLVRQMAGNTGEEARPARSAVVFHTRGEERQAAAGAHENTGALFVVQRTAARIFRSLFP